MNESGSKPTDSVQVIGQDLGMTLTYDASGNLSMTAATDNTVDHYVVSVYNYINRYYTDTSGNWIYDGNDRIGAQETLTGDNTSITLKYYGVCDFPAGTEGVTSDGTMIGGFLVVSYNNQSYYWIDSSKSVDSEGKEYYYFAGSPGQPTAKSTNILATLTAYSETGTVLGSVSATQAGA